MSKFLPVVEHSVEVYKKWYEVCDHLPKKARFGLGETINILFIDVFGLLFTAGYETKENKLPKLEEAVNNIDLLKFFLRIAWEVKALDNKKYIMLSEDIQQLGRMVGGWKKGLMTKLP